MNHYGHFGWILVDTIWDSPNGPHDPLDLVHWKPGKANLVWSLYVKKLVSREFGIHKQS